MFLFHVLGCWTIDRCKCHRLRRRILLIHAFCYLPNTHSMSRYRFLHLYKLFYQHHAFCCYSSLQCKHVRRKMCRHPFLDVSISCFKIFETYSILEIALVFITIWISGSRFACEMSRWCLWFSIRYGYWKNKYLLTLLKVQENTELLLLPFYFQNLKFIKQF